MVLKILGYIVIAIVILVFIYRAFQKSPEKYYRKAKGSHKKGEKYYQLGDPELAKDYYEEAESFRKKAEELKEVP